MWHFKRHIFVLVQDDDTLTCKHWIGSAWHILDWSDWARHLQLKIFSQNCRKEYSCSILTFHSVRLCFFPRSCTTWTGSWRRTGTPCRPTSSWSWGPRRTNSCSSCFPARWPKQVCLQFTRSSVDSTPHRPPARHHPKGKTFPIRQTIANNAAAFFFSPLFPSALLRRLCRCLPLPLSHAGKWVS